ncbi:hypothetical protein HDU98_005807 [Podochytrium sp. JEL0797]|nr:hypothetical protein HDU98_005807 [Podochytrium sp. JEL0797]
MANTTDDIESLISSDPTTPEPPIARLTPALLFEILQPHHIPLEISLLIFGLSFETCRDCQSRMDFDCSHCHFFSCGGPCFEGTVRTCARCDGSLCGECGEWTCDRCEAKFSYECEIPRQKYGRPECARLGCQWCERLRMLSGDLCPACYEVWPLEDAEDEEEGSSVSSESEPDLGVHEE